MMRIAVHAVAGFTLLVVCASPALAQSDRRWGLLFAYPGSVGVQWDATEKFALRLDADYYRFKSTYTRDYSDLFPDAPVRFEPSSTTTTSSYGSIGLSTLFVVHDKRPLTLYLAPRAGLTIDRSASGVISLTAVTVGGIPVSGRLEAPEAETSYGFDVAARFGASYRLGDRFAVFGETGFGYRRDGQSGTSTLDIRTSALDIRAGIGGILYF